MGPLCEDVGSRDYSVEGLIPKRAHFRDKGEGLGRNMLVDLMDKQKISWKDKLVGQSSTVVGVGLGEEDDFE